MNPETVVKKKLEVTNHRITTGIMTVNATTTIRINHVSKHDLCLLIRYALYRLMHKNNAQ